jgi:hypothetical protein
MIFCGGIKAFILQVNGCLVFGSWRLTSVWSIREAFFWTSMYLSSTNQEKLWISLMSMELTKKGANESSDFCVTPRDGVKLSAGAKVVSLCTWA